MTVNKPIYKRENKKWFLKIPVLVSIAALGVCATTIYCFTKTTEDSVNYIFESVKVGDLLVTVNADGNLNPVRTVSLGSELSGIVDKVNVDINDFIKKDEILIELDSENLVREVERAKATLRSNIAQLRQAQASLKEKETKLRRFEELDKESNHRLPARADLESQRAEVAVARAIVDVQKADIENSKANVLTAQNNVEKANIKSPINGVVLSRSVEPGYAVAASLQAVELLKLATDLRNLELRVNIDEADVGVVKPGQKAYFTVSAYPDKHFPAQLKRISFGPNETENVVTYTAYLDVKNEELLLRPGMTANAVIETAKREKVLLIPNTALRYKPLIGSTLEKSAVIGKEDISTKEKEIYVLVDTKPQKRTIKVGLSDGVYTEVLSGNLEPEEKVIVDQTKKTKK